MASPPPHFNHAHQLCGSRSDHSLDLKVCQILLARLCDETARRHRKMVHVNVQPAEDRNPVDPGLARENAIRSGDDLSAIGFGPDRDVITAAGYR